MFRLDTQSAPHRVVVHINKLLKDRGRLEDIAVVTPAPLPKTGVYLSVGLPILHTRKKLRSVAMNK
jgi:hypothetical protein